MDPPHFMEGLFDWLLRAGSINILNRHKTDSPENLRKLVSGAYIFLLQNPTTSPEAISLLTTQHFTDYYKTFQTRILASYPANLTENGSRIFTCLESLFINNISRGMKFYKPRFQKLWVFSDILNSRIEGLLILSSEAYQFGIGLKVPGSKQGIYTI